MFRHKSSAVNLPKPVSPTTDVDKEKFYRTVITQSEFRMMEGGVRRRIVVDGCNFISDASNKARDIYFNTDKHNPASLLILVYDLFHYGFDVHVFVKKYFKNEVGDQDKTTVNYEILNVLESLGIVTVLDDDIDDDERILSYADAKKAMILSKDKYREDKYKKFTSRQRRVGFSVKPAGAIADKGTFPARLHNGIKIVFDQEFRWLSYVVPGEEDYDEVKRFYDNMDLHRRNFALTKLDVLADWYFLEEAICAKSKTRSYPFIEYFDGAMPDSSFEKFWKKYESYRRQQNARRGL